jgi:hypothetical protein
MSRPLKESISRKSLPDKTIRKMVAEELGISLIACDAVLSAYQKLIAKEIRACNKVNILSLFTVTPTYVHPYTRELDTGEVYTTKGRITFYTRIQKLMLDAKRLLNKENKETND